MFDLDFHQLFAFCFLDFLSFWPFLFVSDLLTLAAVWVQVMSFHGQSIFGHDAASDLVGVVMGHSWNIVESDWDLPCMVAGSDSDSAHMRDSISAISHEFGRDIHFATQSFCLIMIENDRQRLSDYFSRPSSPAFRSTPTTHSCFQMNSLDLNSKLSFVSSAVSFLEAYCLIHLETQPLFYFQPIFESNFGLLWHLSCSCGSGIAERPGIFVAGCLGFGHCWLMGCSLFVFLQCIIGWALGLLLMLSVLFDFVTVLVVSMMVFLNQHSVMDSKYHSALFMVNYWLQKLRSTWCWLLLSDHW